VGIVRCGDEMRQIAADEIAREGEKIGIAAAQVRLL
jgi:hypothetical protein